MNIYIFPLSSKTQIENSNPYITNFSDSLSDYFQVINKNKPTSLGIIDILFNIHQIDILILNWIENIPERKGGLFQVIVFYILLILIKFFKIRIVYIMHNKISHTSSNYFLKRKIFKTILKRSDFIITHSTAGIRYATNNFKIPTGKIRFFHHPLVAIKNFPRPIIKLENRSYDLLLWGTVSPYKGLEKFLDYVKVMGLDTRYNILIAGKFSNEDYYHHILNKKVKITIINRYIPEHELMDYMDHSKIILFTYQPDSILSSGSLMDSLFSNSYIIGPDSGAFSDCSELGIINTYNSIDKLADTIENTLQLDLENIIRLRAEFINNYSWDNFALQLKTILIHN